MKWSVAAALVLSAFGAQAAAGPVRMLLSVGSNLGHPSEAPLQYAEQDAARVRDVLVELGGVDASRAFVLLGTDAQTVRERLSELKGRVDELRRSGRSVQLMVFASAHGKDGALHLKGTSLPLAELKQLTVATGAELRVVVVDACDSGAAVRGKGATKGPAYTLAYEPPSAQGDAFLASSGGAESAQEWDLLSGSLFTHHWLTGIRGDADFDHDGRVTLMESFTYASRRTTTQSIDVGQHPQFDLGLRGGSDVVVTELRRGRAVVVLAPALEGRYVLASHPSPNVVAELRKQQGRELRLAVPAGRYLLRHTQGRRVSLREVELPYGGTAYVDGSGFVARDFSEVALKGATLELRPHAVLVHGAWASSPLEGTANRWRGGVGYRFTDGQFWFRGSAAAGRARYRAVGLTTHEWTFALRAEAGVRGWWGPLVWMPGVAVELAQLRQEYVRDREEEIRRSYPALPLRRAYAASVGPRLTVEAPLWGPLFAQLSAGVWARHLPADSQPSWTVGADGEAALGLKF